MYNPTLARLFASAALAAMPMVAHSAAVPTQRASLSAGLAPAVDYGKLPFVFEANGGQVDRAVRFLARGPRYALYLTPTEAVLTLQAGGSERHRGPEGELAAAKKAKPRDVAAIRMQLVGANPRPEISGVDVQPSRSNYLIGNDPSAWRRDVPNYSKVRYTGVYPGIDVVYYGSGGQLEYDFVVAPSADARRIALDFKGARNVVIDAEGNLVLTTSVGKLVQHKPIVYQEINGEKRAIEGKYVMHGKARAGIELAAYDAMRPVVIDPVLVFSTYAGGPGSDSGNAVAIDSDNNLYVAAYNQQGGFPVSANTFQNVQRGQGDVLLFKLDPTGTQLIFATYLGGTKDDFPTGIAVDAQRNIYLVGGTDSADFPVTAGALQTVYKGGTSFGNAFVTKLNPNGNALVYSTYVGGSLGSTAEAVALDKMGFVYASGYTVGDYPTTPGAFQTTYGGGGDDAFVFKLNQTGTAFVYSTYLGGPGPDASDSLTIDDDGFAYISGGAGNGFPTTPGSYQPAWSGGTRDGFVTKLNQDGSGLVWSTYLGGTPGQHFADFITRDKAGNVYAAGTTHGNFQTTPGAFQSTFGGGIDGDTFVVKLDPTGGTMLYATYLGGSDDDYPGQIAVDDRGYLYLTGATKSANYPTTPAALQPTYSGGDYDGILTVLNSKGSALVYSTFLGTSGDGDYTYGIALDSAGNLYVIGGVSASGFPTTPGAYQTTYGGGFSDVIVLKFSPDAVLRNYQGLYWRFPASSQPGWGLNVIHQGDILFVTWFTYDANGKPTWFAAELHLSGPGTYSGDVFTTTGPPFDAVPWDPDTVVETTVGTITLAFTDASNAMFTFSIGNVTITQPITKQLFAAPVPECAWNSLADLALLKYFYGLWWRFPPGSEAGWGANFTHQGNIIFVTWFTYDAAGKPTWYIAVAEKKSDKVYAGRISTVTGSPYFMDPWDASVVVETEVGDLTITFTDGNRASYAYTIGEVSQVKDITQQVFGPPGTACQ